MEKGLEQGIEKGAHLERRRFAEGLIGLLSDEVIAEKTGLWIESVRKLHEGDD